jgi:hypothetical protein
MKHILLFLFITVFISTPAFGQTENEYNLVREGVSFNPSGERTYLLSIDTKSVLNSFIKELNKDFGKAIKKGNIFIWNNIDFDKLHQSEFKVTLRKLNVKGAKEKWTSLFFHAKTLEGEDLLKNSSRSKERIHAYLQSTVNKTLKK